MYWVSSLVLLPADGSRPLKRVGIGTCEGSGKVYPTTEHERPQVELKYTCALSLTSALDGGGWSTPRLGRFTPGKDPVPFT